jgi:hypothetical protein
MHYICGKSDATLKRRRKMLVNLQRLKKKHGLEEMQLKALANLATRRRSSILVPSKEADLVDAAGDLAYFFLEACQEELTWKICI